VPIVSSTIATAAYTEFQVVSPGRASALRRLAQVLWHLVQQDFRLRYRRTLVGWLWSVVQPIVRFAVFGFFFSKIVNTGIENFPAYLFVGIVAWNWFAAGVASATRSVVVRRDLLTRNNISRLTVPLTAILLETMDFLLAIPLVLAFVVFGRGEGLSAWSAVALPLALVQLALMIAIGLLLCVANVRFRDIAIITDLLLFVWIYATPIFYKLERVPPGYREVIRWNPMSVIIRAQRSVLLDATAPNWFELAVIVPIVLLGCVLAIHRFSVRAPLFLDEL
jgi:lipopolysaccharide transport system permease protein